jgi:hypothetical protein
MRPTFEAKPIITILPAMTLFSFCLLPEKRLPEIYSKVENREIYQKEKQNA